jgi:hypothetical protein
MLLKSLVDDRSVIIKPLFEPPLIVNVSINSALIVNSAPLLILKSGVIPPTFDVNVPINVILLSTTTINVPSPCLLIVEAN